MTRGATSSYYSLLPLFSSQITNNRRVKGVFCVKLFCVPGFAVIEGSIFERGDRANVVELNSRQPERKIVETSSEGIFLNLKNLQFSKKM